jgi:hypothetical protein
MELDLSKYRVNHYSQFGEDGVIEKLFQILNIKDGWLVEFGAWDGVMLSNTHYHYKNNKNFDLLLIEPIYERYTQCLFNYLNQDKPIILNKKVELDGNDTLNNILDECKVNDISLLSIDVDGQDLDIWKTLDQSKYRPKIVIIEYDKWQNPNDLNYLVECFKGYNLVCVTSNYIFVRSDLNITSNQNVHELLHSSGSPDYNLHKNRINEDQYHSIVNKLYNIAEHPDIFIELAKPQIIYYD